MDKDEFAFIDDTIRKIPVVGAVWADAMVVWLGLLNAMALAALRDASLEGVQEALTPPRATVVQPLLPLRRAA